MTCCFCGRSQRDGRLVRSWKICGRVASCGKCWHERFRRKSITMAVAEPIGAGWSEFSAALNDVRNPSGVVSFAENAWKLTIEGRRRTVRVLIGNRWWAMRLDDANWSPGRKEAFARIAFGEAAAAELHLRRRRNCERCTENPAGSRSPRYAIECQLLVWLPLCQREIPLRPPMVRRIRESLPNSSVRDQNIEEIDISNLSKAIRHNWVSFPSQVPTFPGCGWPNLQHKLIQLYFVMGWGCATIAARYGLARHQVLHVLNAWKSRAANAGYIQHIPIAEVLSQCETRRSSAQSDYRSAPEVADCKCRLHPTHPGGRSGEPVGT
jgi:hypothetical protein